MAVVTYIGYVNLAQPLKDKARGHFSLVFHQHTARMGSSVFCCFCYDVTTICSSLLLRMQGALWATYH